MFRALILLHPEGGEASPFRALDSGHRSLAAAARRLSLAMGRRDRMRAPCCLACGIVDPDGRVFSLRGAQAVLKGRTDPRFTLAHAVTAPLRVAAGFEPSRASSWDPAPIATPAEDPAP